METAFTLKIGALDISSRVTADGYKWTSSDLHDEKSGRTLDGTMHIYRIGTKIQLDVNCVPMSRVDAAELLAALREQPEFPVTYEDPELGVRTTSCYCSARNCEYLAGVRGVKWWKNIKFTLIEC